MKRCYVMGRRKDEELNKRLKEYEERNKESKEYEERIGYKEMNDLERTLIENLTVYRNLVKRMSLTQPELSLTYILKKDIIWMIVNLEQMKQDDDLIDYKIGWVKNILKVFCINQFKEIGVITLDLIRHRLLHDNNNNIRFNIIGVIGNE